MLRRLLRRLAFPRRDPVNESRSLLNDTPVRAIIDAGAHTGRLARRFLAAFPQATVHAFEPHPESWRALCTLASSSGGRLIPIQAAVGEHSGTAEFNLGARPETSSLLPRPAEGKAYFPPDAVMVGRTSVPVVALDAWAAEQKVAPEILKLDIQGGELKALKGAQSLLKTSLRVVLTEMQFVPLYAGAPLYHELACHLAAHGFSLYSFYDLVTAADGQLVYGDAIFCRL
jgi:FkbM family methyltransferase